MVCYDDWIMIVLVVILDGVMYKVVGVSFDSDLNVYDVVILIKVNGYG